MQQRVDDLILIADVQWQVIGSDHCVYLNLLLLLDLVERPQEEELIYAFLDVSILGLEWSVACDACLDLGREASTEVEVEVGVDCLCFFHCFSILGMISWDEGAISQRFFVNFFFDFCDFVVEILQDLAEGDFLQFFLGDLAALLLQCALRIVEEGLNLREGQIGVALACALPLLDEPYESIVDKQTPQSILHVILLQSCKVEPKDLDELNLCFGLKLFHKRHGQILELAYHIISDLLLPLEDFNKAVEVLMQAQRKSSLLIELIISLLLVIVLLEDRLEVDLIFDFLLKFCVALLVIDGQLSALDVFVLNIVDIEVLLAEVWVDGVELKEVLATDGFASETQEAGMQQSQHHLVVVNNNIVKSLQPEGQTTTVQSNQEKRVIFCARLSINYILIEMIHGAEIRDLLKKRDRGKLDSYMRVIARKKEEESDLMNLLQAWVHSLLYYKQIYAPEAFHERTILGVSVFVASSPPLKVYLDDFFQKIKPHLSHLNYLRLIILNPKDSIVEVNTLHIEDLLQVFGKEYIEEGGNCAETNLLQKQMQIKSFLYDLRQQLEQSRKLMKSEEELTFKLRIGYRHQINQKASRSLLDGWLLREDKPGHGRIACSLKSSNLNLIYQVTK